MFRRRRSYDGLTRHVACFEEEEAIMALQTCFEEENAMPYKHVWPYKHVSNKKKL